MTPLSLIDSAAQLLGTVLRFEAPTDTLVSHYFVTHPHLGQRDRATIAETIYKVIRYKTLYENLCSGAPYEPLKCLAILGFAGPRPSLLSALSPAQAHWLQLCDERIGSPETQALGHCLPPWLAKRLAGHLGVRSFDALAHTLLQPAPLDLRVNTMMGKRPWAKECLQLVGIQTQPTPFSPWGLRVEGKPAIHRLEIFKNGAIEVQDEGSQLLAAITDARRGQMVLDYCAGAGGKTLALGAAMRSTGHLYALDLSASRLAKLKPRLARSGLTNVYPLALTGEHDERLMRLAGKLDRVLVDAPCSGLGTLRRNPDLKWRIREREIAGFAAKQQSILSHAARLLKPGARLVYATCSLLAQENEDTAAAFSSEHPQFEPTPVVEILQRLKIPESHQLCNNNGLYLSLWPHLHATDGFFAAAWTRKT